MSLATTTITSKNQITLPAALLRKAGLGKGVRLSARLDQGTIILEPQTDIAQTVRAIQANLRPLVKRPLSDRELQEALHGWSE